MTMNPKQMVERTWATVSLDNIAYNFRQIRRAAGPGCKVMGVVKADGYGDGDYIVANVRVEEGADFLGV